MENNKMYRKVHVARADGTRIYNHLFDDGTNVLNFESGFGFVLRDRLALNNNVLLDGWY